MLMLSSADISKLTFSKILSGTLSSISNRLDPDQGQHFVSLDIALNCLQRLSTDDKSPLVGKKEIKCHQIIGTNGTFKFFCCF